MIGIIAAMDNEVELLRSLVTDKKTEFYGGIEYTSGKIDGVDICLSRSEIGKVNGALSACLMAQMYRPSFIINTGCSGGMKPFMHVGDVIISDNAFHHDAINFAFGYKAGQIPQEPEKYAMDVDLKKLATECCKKVGLTVHNGDIGAGDSFMCDPKIIKEKQELYKDMYAVDMESAGVAQACYKQNVPCIIIRALSDIAGVESVDYAKFVPVAVDSMVKVVREVLKHYANV